MISKIAIKIEVIIDETYQCYLFLSFEVEIDDTGIFHVIL